MHATNGQPFGRPALGDPSKYLLTNLALCGCCALRVRSRKHSGGARWFEESQTPDSLVIDLTDDGYVALGAEGQVAVIEAEAAMLDRMPRAESDALDVEALRLIEPKIGLTVAKTAIKNLFSQGKLGRLGAGKRGNPHRYFLEPMNSVATQIP